MPIVMRLRPHTPQGLRVLPTVRPAAAGVGVATGSGTVGTGGGAAATSAGVSSVGVSSGSIVIGSPRCARSRAQGLAPGWDARADGRCCG